MRWLLWINLSWHGLFSNEINWLMKKGILIIWKIRLERKSSLVSEMIFIAHFCLSEAVVILVFIDLKLFVFCVYMRLCYLSCHMVIETGCAIWYHFVFLLVIYHQRKLLITKSSQFHCFFDKAFLSFPICCVFKSLVLDRDEIEKCFVFHTFWNLIKNYNNYN